MKDVFVFLLKDEKIEATRKSNETEIVVLSESNMHLVTQSSAVSSK